MNPSYTETAAQPSSTQGEFYDPNDPRYSSYSIPGFPSDGISANVPIGDDDTSLQSDMRYRGTGAKYSGIGSGFLDRNGFSWLLEQTPDDDDDDYSTSILEELDIDLKDIYYKMRCVIFPLPSLGFKRSILSDSPDFWGPLMIVLLYAFISLYGQMSAVSWILTVWLCGSFFVFILTRVLGGEVSYGQCLGIIGYSLIPLILTGLSLLAFSSFYFIAAFLKSVGVFWASYSAGTLLIHENQANKKPLVLYPVFLVYVYFYSIYSGV